MHWIVDGMNVIGSRPDGWWRHRPEARHRLTAELGAFARRTGAEVTAVYDGLEHPGEAALAADQGVAAVFAGGGPGAADRVIVTMVAGLGAGGPSRVVTSDAGLAHEVRTAGVDVMGVSAFRRRLEWRPAPDPAEPR